MPATAGRVRMPANNRVHSSAALQTHGIWQSAIGYDPYAPNKDDSKSSAQKMATTSEPEAENAYASFQGLLALARITGSNADEARGACKKCGRVGHLTFQCRNFLSVKDDNKEKDLDAAEAALNSLPMMDKLKGTAYKANGKTEAESEDSEEDEEESESSDSDVDSEMERIIAKRYGKKLSSKRVKENSSKEKKKDESEDDDSDSDPGKRKKRGRSKKRKSGRRRSSPSEDEDEVRRKRRRERRRKRDDSSDEEEYRRRRRKSRKEKRRRRSHKYSDESNSDELSDPGRSRRLRQKSRKVTASSDSEAASLEDSRVGRDAKRTSKSSRRRHHEEDESS